MRVMLLITDLERGGTPMRVVRWARWLREIGVEPAVGCLAPRGPLSDELDAQGIANFACGARSRADVRAFRRLTGCIRQVNPDILHAFLFHANIAARLVGRLDRNRPIVTSTATIEIERRWHRTVESLTRNRSTAHVVNSPSVARHVIDELGFDPQRVHVIPNGVDFESIDLVAPISRNQYGITRDAALIAWAGRMDPVKGLDIWVEVFDRIRRKHRVCGVLIGDGPARAAVERDVNSRGLAVPLNNTSASIGTIRLVGWHDAPAAWFKSADVMLFTSHTEGNPNAVLEAMAAKCPVVASAVGGCVDLLGETDGMTAGWLSSAGNVNAFESAVTDALNSPPIRREYALAAHGRIWETQSKQTVQSTLKSLYDSL